MEQPNLGRKIVELRKAKGLTQDELVQKCKLNVRTLQRIETGEVTPRVYTIRAIFMALDYDTSNDATYNSVESSFVIPDWLIKSLNYLCDLFNLKTNTMKKISILSTPFVVAFLTLFLINVISADAISKKNLTGTWMLCDNYGNPKINDLDGKKTIRFKVMAESSMVWIEVDQSTNVAYMLYFGSYKIKKGQFIETLEHTSTGLEIDRGIINNFDTKIKKDLWYVKGTNNSYNEVWKKTEPFGIL